MKIKKVNRYYCDFCKKSGCSAYHIKRHEIHCTNNPNRICRMCKMMDREQRNIAEIIAGLPKPEEIKEEYSNFDGYDLGDTNLVAHAEKCLSIVREAVDNCPACILAVMRQSGASMLFSGFDFKAECKETWDRFNDVQKDYGGGY